MLTRNMTTLQMSDLRSRTDDGRYMSLVFHAEYCLAPSCISEPWAVMITSCMKQKLGWSVSRLRLFLTSCYCIHYPGPDQASFFRSRAMSNASKSGMQQLNIDIEA